MKGRSARAVQNAAGMEEAELSHGPALPFSVRSSRSHHQHVQLEGETPCGEEAKQPPPADKLHEKQGFVRSSQAEDLSVPLPLYFAWPSVPHDLHCHEFQSVLFCSSRCLHGIKFLPSSVNILRGVWGAG